MSKEKDMLKNALKLGGLVALTGVVYGLAKATEKAAPVIRSKLDELTEKLAAQKEIVDAVAEEVAAEAAAPAEEATQEPAAEEVPAEEEVVAEVVVDEAAEEAPAAEEVPAKEAAPAEEVPAEEKAEG